MFDLFNLVSSCGLDCAVKRAPLVDVSQAYSRLIPKKYISEGFSVTSDEYKQEMFNQVMVYGQLSTDNSFWDFISNRTKKDTLQFERIENFIRNGIPPQYRSKVWLAMSCKTIPEQCTLYYDLREVTDEDYESQIRQDASLSFHKIIDPTFIMKLTRVLTAYSNRNPKIGYSLPLNILAGTILIFAEEEHAFWLLVHLIEDLFPNYHSLTMSGFFADAEVFKWLLAEDLPELHKHFQRIHCDISALIARWFLCLYANSLPSETAFLVWDNILYEGRKAVFEVGLAIFRMLQDELMEFNNECDLVNHVHTSCRKLHDPKRLRAYWKKLDQQRVEIAREHFEQPVEEEERRTARAVAQLDEIRPYTCYSKQDLVNIWHQVVIDFPFMCCGTAGLDFIQFSQLIGGTFIEWDVDTGTVERLYNLAEFNSNGTIGFHGLVSMFSVLSRGTFEEVVQFNFNLFDVQGRGWLDKFDLARMLQSIYGMFKNEEGFSSLVHNLVNDIFNFPQICGGAITLDMFQYIVLVQPQIMGRFTTKYREVKFNMKRTYFYWLDVDRPARDEEVIQIGRDHTAHIKQSNVLLPSIFTRSMNFSAFEESFDDQTTSDGNMMNVRSHPSQFTKAKIHTSIQQERTRPIKVIPLDLSPLLRKETSFDSDALYSEPSTPHLNDSQLVDSTNIRKIRPHLPVRFQRSDWELKYSTTVHGVSNKTFYSHLKKISPSLLFIEDTNGNVFGAYVSEPWQEDSKGSYYGTGESFLFKLAPEFAVYKWSRKDSFFMCSNPSWLAVGGGTFGFGLCVGADFEQGMSSPSTTFNSPPLCNGGAFRCTILEAWAVDC